MHVGAGNLEDVLQAQSLQSMPTMPSMPAMTMGASAKGAATEKQAQAQAQAQAEVIRVVTHGTFHHNVPMYLEREGQLVPLFKRELLRLLLR